MLLNKAWVMFVAGAVAGCAAQSVVTPGAGEACSLSRPPRDAGVVSNHGIFAFVSPRALPRSYTGCQVMWDESGSPQYVLRFANGDLEEFATYPGPSDADKRVEVCRYAGRKLLTAAPAECPSYDSVKGGVRALPRDSEPQVPSSRDPRSRSL
jgi:hypothetical protein